MDAKKTINSVPTSSKWQTPVIKGRFSKTVWLGNPSEPTLPVPIHTDRLLKIKK